MIYMDLCEEIIFTDLKVENSDDALSVIGNTMTNEGYAKETYVDALIKRESEFPTGLDIDGFGVAIPHTTVDHVNKAGIAVAILKDPVVFTQMGTDDEFTNVHIVFMLAVVNPEAHLENLQKLVEIIQDKEILTQLKEAKTKQEIINLIKEKEKSL